MRPLRELGTVNLIFLVLNIIAIVFGIFVMVSSGPGVAVVLLTVGAVGLAIKKIGFLFEPATPPSGPRENIT